MSSPGFLSVASWKYRDIAAVSIAEVEAVPEEASSPRDPAPIGLSEQEVQARVDEALKNAERQCINQLQAVQSERDAKLAAALEAFAAQQKAYFGHIEAEVVHLALAIARKILQREAQIDPTLLSALVRIALDRMGTDSLLRIRLAPETVESWRSSATLRPSAGAYELCVDGSLAEGDCIVETKLGAANFGFEAQLKEIEKGFLDLLAKRPALL